MAKKSELIKLDVLNRFSGAVQFTAEIECKPDELPSVKLGLAVKWAIKAGADLTGADLADADLTGADLTGANLARAYLARANLAGADLAGAYLAHAYLAGADLTGADLTGANLARAYLARANLAGADLAGAYLAHAYLAGADLSRAYLARAYLARADLAGAYLAGADLAGADLAGANLSGANLTDAYLTDAYLTDADLTGANLTGAKNAELAIAKTRILPEGDLIGWKKCQDGVIVKLRIPADAKRSHAFGRKCRAEFVDVLEVIGAEFGIAKHDGSTEYRVGQRVKPDSFCEDWTKECAAGIHFFITRLEAEEF